MSTLTIWLTIGFVGQALFTARFVLQWVASERRSDSVVPVAFWWLSLAGGLTLLAYAIFRCDPVIIAGQGIGLVVYARNLMLVNSARERRSRCQWDSTDEAAASTKRVVKMTEMHGHHL